MQDLNDKTTGDSLTATEWNQLPSEIQNVIEALGIALSSGDLNQLGKAIAGYVANGDYYTDSGAADAYVLSVVGSKQAPTAYTDGMRAVFRPSATNTGAATVNVAGLGVKSIKTEAGADPSAGTIVAGGLVSLVYISSTGVFELNEIYSALRDSDLATNSGTLPQVDQVNTFTQNMLLQTSFAANNPLTLPAGGLYLEAGTEGLDIRTTSTPEIVFGRDSNKSGVAGAVLFHLGILGFYSDGVSGGGKGSTSINFAALYEDGNRVGPIDSAIVELGGDFNAGEEVLCTIQAERVTITGIGSSLTHTSTNSANTNAGAIPSTFRPTNRAINVFDLGSVSKIVDVDSGGVFRITYIDMSGAAVSQTSSAFPPSITYNRT